ncbi:transcriptional regulatory protein OmpR [Roseibium sp. TrichSKD4]|uniref:response regulator n=1 Tax=Roseibium sp. TrichSKD4 TaxID=744980 RepID=UPI0001E56AAB|nr:response regulator transcription factor [Roseibium sp. TrichSKD4]EFO31136.1 transcriptional regulatory protein OmpR [Roseibium sp. TrichSKD4]
MRLLETSVDRRARVAIIDDDKNVRQSLCDLLHENGFDPIELACSREFFSLGSDAPVDLALIDLRLDGESGLSLAIRIRETQDLPNVMLTGVGDEVDKIVGLETGADDFLMKPFNPRELIARIRAVLRRYGVAYARETKQAEKMGTAFRFGDLILDVERRELRYVSGEEVSVTNAEYRLLEYFLRHPNETIPRKRLLEELGSDLTHYVDRTIDVLILRLRRKIERVPSKPAHLQTRRGLGYVFVVDIGRGEPK